MDTYLKVDEDDDFVAKSLPVLSWALTIIAAFMISGLPIATGFLIQTKM